jgi:hypothetical protein
MSRTGAVERRSTPLHAVDDASSTAVREGRKHAMSHRRARLLEPVSASTPDESDSGSAADIRQRPECDSTSAEALEATQFLVWDLVDEWGAQSFPASDPPANW